MVTPDLELLGRLLLRTEADVHRAGWDAPPQLRVLYDVRDPLTDQVCRRIMAGNARLGPATRVDGYVAQPMLSPAFFADKYIRFRLEPWEVLRTFVMALAYPAAYPAMPASDAAHTLEILRAPGLLGFACCVEAFGSPHGVQTPLGRAQVRGEAPFQGADGSVETRRLYAATVNGRLALAERVRRGGKPRLDLASDVRGDITTSLRILIDAVNGTVPPIDEFDVRYPALRTLYPAPDSR